MRKCHFISLQLLVLCTKQTLWFQSRQFDLNLECCIEHCCCCCCCFLYYFCWLLLLVPLQKLLLFLLEMANNIQTIIIVIMKNQLSFVVVVICKKNVDFFLQHQLNLHKFIESFFSSSSLSLFCLKATNVFRVFCNNDFTWNIACKDIACRPLACANLDWPSGQLANCSTKKLCFPTNKQSSSPKQWL